MSSSQIVDAIRRGYYGAGDRRRLLGATIIGSAREIVGTIVTRDVRDPTPGPVVVELAGIVAENVDGARRVPGRTLMETVGAIVAGTMIGAWRDAATLMLVSLEARLPGLRAIVA